MDDKVICNGDCKNCPIHQQESQCDSQTTNNQKEDE